MLTKDLLRCRLDGTRVIPLFLPLEDRSLLDLASRMLACFPAEGGSARRGEIGNTLEALVDGSEDVRLVRGLRKILEDRAVFSTPEEMDYASERRRVFQATAALLGSGVFLPEAEGEFRRMVESRVDSPLLCHGALYADLPENDRFQSLRSLSPRELLERYNLGLVQGLLLQSERMDLTLESAAPSRLRRMLTLARFHRLIVDARTTAPADLEGDAPRTALKLAVDGPASVLEQSKSYGFQLASVFPAVVGLERWRMRAMVEWRGRVRSLVLDERSGLTSLRATGAFVPPEVEMFRQDFAANARGWRLEEECPFLKGGAGRLVIPDFRFTAPDGQTVYLELFCRLHDHAGLERLDRLEEGAPWPLLLGIDRTVAARPAIRERLENASLPPEHLFLYRDYPTVDKTCRALRKLLERLSQ